MFEITRCPTPPGRPRPCARSRETAPPRGRRSEGLGLPGKSTGEVSSGGLLRSRPATREAPNTRGVRPDPSAWPAGPVPSHRRPGPLGFRPGCGLSPGLRFPTRHPVCRGAHHPPPVPAAGPPQGSAAANPPRTPQSRHRSPAGLGAPSATHLIHALCLLRQKPHFSEEPHDLHGEPLCLPRSAPWSQDSAKLHRNFVRARPSLLGHGLREGRGQMRCVSLHGTQLAGSASRP